jgi:RNA polymerase sigma-70 factor (ECF subfamily)
MDSRILRQLKSDTAMASRAAGDEWALVQHAISGEPNAMELLFAPHMHRLYLVALSILRNKEDAEDALQDGLCNAYSCLGSFQGRSSFSTWLTRIVMNSALMILRKRRTRSESSLDEVANNQPDWPMQLAIDNRSNPEQVCALLEIIALIEEQIQKLPLKEQAEFRCYAINGLSTRESCVAFGVPESTFKSRILRTRRKLGHELRNSVGKAYNISHQEKSLHAVKFS